jgi:HAMP domain-containing protein
MPVPGLRQKTLSAAAKIDLIVSEHERPVPKSEIGRLAKEVGWSLSEGEVSEALGLLTRLDLVSLIG